MPVLTHELVLIALKAASLTLDVLAVLLMLYAC